MTRNRFFARILVVSFAALASMQFTPEALAAPTRSPQGQVVVVTNNLHSNNGAELDDLSEAGVFARRVLEDVPYRPDVILLQEVVRKSAKKVAAEFTTRTSDQYVVVRSSPLSRGWVRVSTNKVINTDTAIIINASTTELLDQGGWINMAVAASDVAGEQVVRRTAYAMVTEIGSNVQMPVASLHFLRPSEMRTRELAFKYQEKWTTNIANLLRDKYPGGSLKVIAGDFNEDRCVNDPYPNCEPLAPYYAKLTGSPYNYVDTVWTMIRKGAVDHLFATGALLAAGADTDYDKAAALGDPTEWYSDHIFHWALIH